MCASMLVCVRARVRILLVVYVCIRHPPLIFSHTIYLTLGAVYIKNCICRYWKHEEPVAEGDEVQYSIPDVAKSFIRENIVGAVIKSPLFVW